MPVRTRPARVLMLSVTLCLFSQIGAQLLSELRFPMALKLGPLTAVLFLDTDWLRPDRGSPSGAPENSD